MKDVISDAKELGARVTRLGEFLHIGHFLTLGSDLKVT
jgi:hypothetical protein